MVKLLKKLPKSRRGWTVALVLLVGLSAWAMRDDKLPTYPGTVWIDCRSLSESSGLARSRLHANWLWTHNDSGDSARLFAIDLAGQWKATLEVKKADSLDWEDLCSFQREGQSYLAIADVGDNGHARKHVTIYIVSEPDSSDIERAAAEQKDGKKAKPLQLSARPKCVLEVKYPDGPVNCEAIAYDPWREQFILASKEQLRSRLFAVDFRLDDEKQKVTAQQIGAFGIPLATGASISDDGTLLVVGTYGPSCILRRAGDTDWKAASPAARRQASWVSAKPGDLELVEAPPRRQGESVCFDATGRSLFMTSEGSPAPLIKIELQP